jgi:hypothetical protein
MADRNKNTEGIEDNERINVTPKVRNALANQASETGPNGYEYTNEREPKIEEKNGLGE